MAVSYDIEGTTYSFPDVTTREEAVARVKNLKVRPQKTPKYLLILTLSIFSNLFCTRTSTQMMIDYITEKSMGKSNNTGGSIA